MKSSSNSCNISMQTICHLEKVSNALFSASRGQKRPAALINARKNSSDLRTTYTRLSKDKLIANSIKFLGKQSTCNAINYPYSVNPNPGTSSVYNSSVNCGYLCRFVMFWMHFRCNWKSRNIHIFLKMHKNRNFGLRVRLKKSQFPNDTLDKRNSQNNHGKRPLQTLLNKYELQGETSGNGDQGRKAMEASWLI
ncbi:hypothetical protein WN51_04470 [Melipona quadrifasciata]|uniref:Uncharacterized protein n=1 Tax=Melipona quadrifasciata TaxID=166423 RepID=A0A0M8ZS17_9HYME|nr:hypothetical protein WN51_04470 [Melipona quadrifasciata]